RPALRRELPDDQHLVRRGQGDRRGCDVRIGPELRERHGVRRHLVVRGVAVPRVAGAGRSRIALVALRAWIALVALQTLETLRPGETLRAVGAVPALERRERG